MKSKITLTAVIPALMLAFAGYAQEPEATTKAKPDAKGAIEVGAITETSKVTAVDSAERTVTLTNQAGETNSYKLGKNVRNFDQIKVGDQVTLLDVNKTAEVVSISEDGTQYTVKHTDDGGAEQTETVTADKLGPVNGAGKTGDEEDGDEGDEGQE